MKPPTPTLPQTLGLLAMSRGAPSSVLTPMSRKMLLRAQWIAPASDASHRVTVAGMRALAGSPHLDRARRDLDRGLPSVRSLTTTTGLTLGDGTPSTRKVNRRRAMIAAAVLRGGGR